MNTPTSSTSNSMDSGSSYGRPGASAVPRAIPLSRGEACLSCRRRKMKCDAGRPSCAPCTRAGRAGECEYEDTQYMAKIAGLEDQVRVLQGRIRELEGDAPFSAFLPRTHDDRDRGPGPGSAQPPAPRPPPPPQPHYHPQPAVQQPTQGGAGDDYQALVPQLLHQFAARAHEFGLPPVTTAHLAQHAALSAAACAIAAPSAERAFVLRAEAALARTAAHAGALDVQAAALLARLAFARGRTLEGQRHLGAALRVARALRLREADPAAWALVVLAAGDAGQDVSRG